MNNYHFLKLVANNGVRKIILFFLKEAYRYCYNFQFTQQSVSLSMVS